MPGENENLADQTSGDQTGNDAEAETTTAAHDIASSASNLDFLDDDPATQTTEAPADGNANTDDKSEAAPADGQPEGDETDKKDDKTKDDKTDADDSKTEGDDALTPEEVEAARATELEEIRVATGLSPIKGDDQYDAIHAKYSESSKENHRLVDERHAEQALLSSVGVQIIQKDDGSLALAPTEEYGKDLDVSADSRRIFDTLPPELSDKIDSDEAKAHVIEHILKEANKINLSRQPSVNATSDDLRLDNGIVDSIFTDMSNVKIGKGDDARPFFADIEETDVTDTMVELYESPGARDFMITANKNAENMKWFLGALHGMVQRGRAPILAAKRDATNIANKAKETNRSEASIGTSGDSGKGTPAGKSDNTGEGEAHAIASSSGNGWS